MRQFRFVKGVTWFFGLAAVCRMCTIPGQAADLRTFRSETYGYIAQYPKGWYPDVTRTSDTLDIDSFPARKAVRAVHIPPGGAEIMLAPLEAVRQAEMPRTLADWITIDNRRPGVVDERQLEIDSPDGRLSITEMKRDCCAVAPFSESVAWYFQLKGRPFKALLVYWKGDPNLDKLRQTLQQIVSSIRLIPQ